jgi:hypothetical protein
MNTRQWPIKYCVIHASTQHDERTERCTWTVWAGPRPAAAPCKIVSAVVEWEEG